MTLDKVGNDGKSSNARQDQEVLLRSFNCGCPKGFLRIIRNQLPVNRPYLVEYPTALPLPVAEVPGVCVPVPLGPLL